jgi:hypothetical protein
MNIINNLTEPTTPLRITLTTTPLHNPTATGYQTMPFGAETYKALEVLVDWWRIKTNDPRVRVTRMKIPGPRSGKNREQE